MTHERPLTLSIKPAVCLRELPANERSYIVIPAPAWIARDPLKESFSRYADLWFGGKVVWAAVVQANNALFSAGDADAPAEIIYDPTGTFGHADLADAAMKAYALKDTQPADPKLRALAEHLTDELGRAFGMPVPETISRFPLLISTVLMHRNHLPGKKLALSYFPILINDKFPGVVMVLPSRWWPQQLLDRWAAGTAPAAARAAGDAGALAAASPAGPSTVLPSTRRCSNCKEPMRKLGLAAHYQRTVEIDVCEPCSLIWFDDTNSTKLAGPGLADLMRIIHGAMQKPRPLQPLPPTLTCPICTVPLKRVSNVSRYGRTAQLECPEKHGAYQSFSLLLAEKGYFRPFTWADIKKTLDSGKQLFCFNCGGTLEPRPHKECQYCQSPVGMIDPARLASAIDVDRVAQPLQLAPSFKKSACPCCGGAIDLTGEMICPYCKAVVRPVETEGALAASAAVESEVRENYEQQMAEVSRRKLEVVMQFDMPISRAPRNEGVRRGVILLIVFLSLGYFFLRYSTRNVSMEEVNEDGRPVGMNPMVWEAKKQARREKEMAVVPHAPNGVVPGHIEVARDGDRVTVVSRMDKPIKVGVNIYNINREERCKMFSGNAAAASTAPNVSNAVTFSKRGESHVFTVGPCKPEVMTGGSYEYRVWSIEDSKYLFKSESAFY